MCLELSDQDLYLNINLKIDDCQVVHIHNDPLAKFVLLAKFKMRKNDSNLLDSMTIRLITQQENLHLSLHEISYENSQNKEFKIVLEPFIKNPKKEYTYSTRPAEEIKMDSKDEFINNIQFLINGEERDHLIGDTGFGDQACRYKII